MDTDGSFASTDSNGLTGSVSKPRDKFRDTEGGWARTATAYRQVHTLVDSQSTSCAQPDGVVREGLTPLLTRSLIRRDRR
ncbi:hypothetical protein GCM10010498_11070 [Streptomyces cavourensis]|nr:hypothetical protein GCM10010498_11070 [Streptomyces cavourensis]